MNKPTPDILGGKYTIRTGHYLGADFSPICLVFPGQNSIYPGAFKSFYQHNHSVAAFFAQGDTLAAKYNLSPLSDYILGKTNKNSVLSLFTMQVALAQSLLKEKLPIAMLTGHSIGEMAAMVTSGIVSFEDMFEIVYWRELYSPPAHSQGEMIAIKATPEQIIDTLPTNKYFVSNINNPLQTVISVAPDNLKTITSSLRQARLKFVQLDLPQPYHSPLLNILHKKLATVIEQKQMEIRCPAIPIYSFVLNKVISSTNFEANEIKNSIAQQVVAPINFISQINGIYPTAVSFLELSERPLCSPFIDRILTSRPHSILNLSKYLPLVKSNHHAAKIKDGMLFNLLRQIIAKTTGHQLDSIHIEDRYQDDLNIDSIKKAEIFYEIVRETKATELNSSQFDSIGETLDYLQTRSENKTSASPQYQPTYSRATRSWSPQKYLYQPSAKLSHQLVDLFSPLSAQHLVYNLFNLPFDDLASSVKDTLIPFIIKWKKSSAVDITLAYNQEDHPLVAGLLAFFFSLAKEKHISSFKAICFPHNTNFTDVYSQVLAEANYPFGAHIKFENSSRYVANLVALPSAQEHFEIKTLLATGGAKGITRHLLLNLPSTSKIELHLIGRSAPAALADSLAKLSSRFAKVIYHQCDIRDKQLVAQLPLPEIDLLIHAAGVEHSEPLTQKSDEHIAIELETKLFGLSHLLQHKIKRIINFSSITSYAGNAGQSCYACANAMLEKFIPQAKTIAWPAWKEMGMTQHPGISQLLQQQGMELLPPEKASAFFNQELYQSAKMIYYLDQYDLLLFNRSLHDLNSLTSLIGEIRNLQAHKTFDLRFDTYLQGHKITDQIVVPAATAIAMFLVESFMMQNRFTLENFKAINPLIISDSTVTTTEIQKRSESLQLILRSSLTHFQAQISTTQKQIDLKTSSFQGEKQDSNQIYNQLLFHRPPFQVIKEITYPNGGACGKLAELNTSLFATPFWGQLILKLDALWQTLALGARHHHQVSILPSKAITINYFPQNDGPNLQISTSPMERLPKGIRADLVLQNSRGWPVLHIEGAYGEISNIVRRK